MSPPNAVTLPKKREYNEDRRFLGPAPTKTIQEETQKHEAQQQQQQQQQTDRCGAMKRPFYYLLINM